MSTSPWCWQFEANANWAIAAKATLKVATQGLAHRGEWAGAYRNLHHPGMKTTLNLNDQLLADAKALAAQQRTSLTRLIEEGLQLRLRAKPPRPCRRCRCQQQQGPAGGLGRSRLI